MSPPPSPPRRRKPPRPGGPASGRGRRRSFSQQTLAVRQQGPAGEVLLRALELPPRSGYVLTHRFHPYPGRFHHHLPGTLLAAFPPTQGPVCDPFMGGGTTLVEAMLLGLPAVGNDLNPVATLVARERTRPRTPLQAGQVSSAAQRIAAQVEGLRREKNPPRIHLPNFALVAREYQPHLLAELVQWHRLIDAEAQPPVRETLRAVFSSGAVKFSNRTSDAQPAASPPRYPKGAVTRFFTAKSEELVRAQVALAQKLPGPRRVTLLEEDARLLPSLAWGSVAMVVTSPPYPGTYDYADQHALRMAWLGLESAPLVAGEVGSRRGSGGGGAPGGGWGNVMRDVMSSMARILMPGGALFLVMGDWIEGSHAVDAAEGLGRVALAKGWRVDSAASVRREVFSHLEKKAFAKRGKWEHLIRFTRAPEQPTAKSPAGENAPGPGAPRDGAPRKGAPGDGAPRKGAPGDGAPRKGTPGDGAPRKGTPGEGAPRKGAPGDGAPRKGTPGEGAPRKGAAQKKPARGKSGRPW